MIKIKAILSVLCLDLYNLGLFLSVAISRLVTFLHFFFFFFFFFFFLLFFILFYNL